MYAPLFDLSAHATRFFLEELTPFGIELITRWHFTPRFPDVRNEDEYELFAKLTDINEYITMRDLVSDGLFDFTNPRTMAKRNFLVALAEGTV